MKVLIAPDSFKDSLSAMGVANSIEKGILAVDDSVEIHKIPLADGGEGFTRALILARGGKEIETEVLDPLSRPIKAKYGLLDDGTAIIEMAAASGIELLTLEERNPLHTSTIGTGLLIRDAIERGSRKIIIGIGGSATNDGGVGMAMALGYRFLDKDQQSIKEGNGALNQLQTIDQTNVLPELAATEVLVACDVTNLLTGENGASAIYGPQKGATPEMIEQLDNNLEHLATIIKEQLNIEVSGLPGGGAAGGLGAGLVAFSNGKLQSGFDIVSAQTKLEAAIASCDLVVTGEGKIDGQTLQGKTPWGVAQIARKYNKPVIGIAGTLGNGYQELYAEGFKSIFSISQGPADLQFCLANASRLIEETTAQIFRLILLTDQ